MYDESRKTEALAAILNSAIFEFLLKLSSPRLGTRYFRYMKQYLGAIPTPNPENMTSETVSHLSGSYSDKDWDAVNDRVFDLYKVPKALWARVTRLTTVS